MIFIHIVSYEADTHNNCELIPFLFYEYLAEEDSDSGSI